MLSAIIDVQFDQHHFYVKKNVPVTINYRLVTNGSPPAVGSRIEFGFDDIAAYLHASTPPSGATITTWGFGRSRFTSITITGEQTQGWNTQRTLTVLPSVSLDPSRISQLCAIKIYQPYEDGYWSVFAKGDTSSIEAINARFEYKTKWFDIGSQSWVYSYDIVLKANVQTVRNWKLSFCDLPLGTRIHSELWANVTHDGSEGVVEVVTPGDDKYTLKPGQELPISIQLRYPAAVGQRPDLETLRYLVAYPQ